MRVEELRQEFALEVELWAYDLRPDLPPEGLPRELVYRGARYSPQYFQHLRQVAEESGIRLGLPPVVASTHKAHEATEFAKEHGAADGFARAVFAAYWEGEENIGEVGTLCRLAQECGLDGEALRQELASGRHAKQVEAQMAWARRESVGGVPTIIFDGRFALVGAQSYDVFKSIAERILAKRGQG